MRGLKSKETITVFSVKVALLKLTTLIMIQSQVVSVINSSVVVLRGQTVQTGALVTTINSETMSLNTEDNFT